MTMHRALSAPHFPALLPAPLAALLLALALALPALVGCGSCEDDASTETAEGTAEPAEPAPEPLEALPESVDFDQAKMVLGRALYFDTRLSGDNTISCATCHELGHGGAEPRAVSTGIGGAQGPINSPTVLNARYNLAQFWDGRAADLQAQASGPVANPGEMGSTWEQVLEELKAVPGYAEQFGALYDDGITEANVTDAIAEYEGTLITPSPFDAYLRGDEDAIDQAQRRGHETFKEVGCTACHTGMNVGGSMYQKMGLVRDWLRDQGREITEADAGRFNHTGEESDRHFFKVPTLRNVANSAPYFHDGSEEDLAGAVRTMGTYQLGIELSDAQVSDIVAFLESLTGELPAHAALPEGGIPAGPEAAATAE